MSKKKETKIVRPGGSADVPDAQQYDPETFEPKNVDKEKALKQWFDDAKKKKGEGSSSVTINPKQAYYAKKHKKKK